MAAEPDMGKQGQRQTDWFWPCSFVALGLLAGTTVATGMVINAIADWIGGVR